MEAAVEDRKLARVRLLKKVEDERGSVMHIMRKEVYGWGDIGEVYGSYVKAGVVKGWYRNMEIRQNMVVVCGEVKFVMYEEETGVFQEEILGGERHGVLEVEAGIWYGFRGEGEEGGVVVNVMEKAHEEWKVEKLDIENICYIW